MKILMVVSTLDTGGAQRAVSNLACNLPEEWDIDILLNDADSIVYPYRGRILTLGLPPKEDKLSLIYQMRVVKRRVSLMRRLKRDNVYDACISFMDSANFANILSGRKHCKTILSVRIDLNMIGKTSLKYRYIVSPIAGVLYKRADSIVSVSETITSDLIEHYGVSPDRAVTIYNGVDIDRIDKLKDEKASVDNDTFNICHMGRFVKQKGHWHLLKAFASFHRDHPDSGLYLLGEGELEGDIRRLAAELGILSSVMFEGFIENPYSVMSRCDLYVFPSIYEGFSNALVEAMACGLPVIASDCGSGNREIIAPATPADRRVAKRMEMAEYGILIPTGDGEPDFSVTDDLTYDEMAMYDAMNYVYADSDYREQMARKACERAGQLSVASMTENWAGHIRSVCGER